MASSACSGGRAGCSSPIPEGFHSSCCQGSSAHPTDSTSRESSHTLSKKNGPKCLEKLWGLDAKQEGLSLVFHQNLRYYRQEECRISPGRDLPMTDSLSVSMAPRYQLLLALHQGSSPHLGIQIKMGWRWNMVAEHPGHRE